MQQNLEENFRILRARVEDAVTLPARIVVSAALHGDGTTYVACGLARAFAEAGHTTLILDACNAAPQMTYELGIKPLDDIANLNVRNGEIARLSVGALSDLTKAGASALRTLAAKFAVTIIDTPPIAGSGAALQLAQSADALIFAVKRNRKPSPADDELLRTIGSHRSKLLGTVMTFSGLRDKEIAPVPVRGRRRAGAPVPATEQRVPAGAGSR
jgi:Mrp family chromosome partitioning ATPase